VSDRTADQVSTEGWTTCEEHEIAYRQGGACPKCALEEELALIAHGYHESGGVGE
jgi:hypothetical protein